MGKRAKAGTSLEELTRSAIPLLKEAERQCPRTGPGAKPMIPDWFLGVLIMVAVLKRKKHKSAQFRFVTDPANRRMLTEATGQTRFPARSTFFDRYRRAHRLFAKAIELQGRRAIAEQVVDAREVAVDKSLIRSLGPAWHKRDRQAGRVRRGVDRDTTWGYSKHDGWVQGYGYEVVVSSTPGFPPFPLVASVDTASTSETRTFGPKIACLPETTRCVSADAGYDSNALAEQVEGSRRGRRFLCPENPRNKQRPKTKPGGADASRARSRRLRKERQAYYRSARGRRIYARRKTSAEPFNQWFKSLFEIDDHVWHRSLDNNRTQILAAMFVYQLLVRHNHKKGNANGRIRGILDAL